MSDESSTLYFVLPHTYNVIFVFLIFQFFDRNVPIILTVLRQPILVA